MKRETIFAGLSYMLWWHVMTSQENVKPVASLMNSGCLSGVSTILHSKAINGR